MPIAQARGGHVRGRLRLRRHRRSAAGSRSTRPTCSSSPTRHGGHRSVPRRTPTLSLICNIVDPITTQPYARDPRYIAQQGRGVPEVDRHRRHVVLRPRGRVLHLRRRPLRLEGPNARYYIVDSRRRRAGTRAARRARTSATSRATRTATSRCRRPTRCTDLRTEMMLTLEAVGIEVEVAPPRGRHRPVSARST